MGRPEKYKTYVEPYLDEIKEMCLTMSEEQIADTLHVGYSSFRLYKQKYPALADALKKGRKTLVMELRSALIRKAKGFHEVAEVREITKGDGTTTVEKITRYYPPDVAALNLALKNYDRENWANDPQMIEIRKRELELQEKRIENSEW